MESKNDSPDSEPLSKEGVDIEGTISGGELPARKVRLWLGKKIWAILIRVGRPRCVTTGLKKRFAEFGKRHAAHDGLTLYIAARIPYSPAS